MFFFERADFDLVSGLYSTVCYTYSMLVCCVLTVLYSTVCYTYNLAR